jgi:hypothetical protein
MRLFALSLVLGACVLWVVLALCLARYVYGDMSERE